LLRALDVYVEPLVIAGRIRELVYLVLRNRVRLAFTKRLANPVLQLARGDRQHG
jgi:hypothetical protein